MEFVEFPKMARMTRRAIITEKIDGANATIFIGEGGEFLTGSRTRWITPDDDNHGFARWAHEHKDELMGLGPGWHRGEWFGKGIQRGYGLDEKRFALFNTTRWCAFDEEPELIESSDPDPRTPPKMQERVPACCLVVPVLFDGEFDTMTVGVCLNYLRINGSLVAPGFMKPEGVVVFHAAAGIGFKKTIDKDDQPKSRAK